VVELLLVGPLLVGPLLVVDFDGMMVLNVWECEVDEEEQ